MLIRNATPADVITCAEIQMVSGGGAKAKYLKKDELLSRKYLRVIWIAGTPGSWLPKMAAKS